MGIADVFFWVVMTGLGALCTLIAIGASMFCARVSTESKFFAALAALFFYASYCYWPFQVVMKVAS